MGFIGKLSSAAKNRTTYRVGLLQAKAYRILKQETTRILKPLGVSTIEWAFLGLLLDNGPIQARTAALELGVEPPYVTVMAAKLAKKGLLSMEKMKADSRYKTLSITPEGKAFVHRVEPIVRAQIRPLVAKAGALDLIGYLAILEIIVGNGKKSSKK